MSEIEVVTPKMWCFKPLTSAETLVIVYGFISGGEVLDLPRAERIIREHREQADDVFEAHIHKIDDVVVDCHFQEDGIFITHYSEWEKLVERIEEAKEQKSPNYATGRWAIRAQFERMEKRNGGRGTNVGVERT